MRLSRDAVSRSPKGESDDDRDRDTGRDKTVLNGPGTELALHEARGKFEHWRYSLALNALEKSPRPAGWGADRTERRGRQWIVREPCASASCYSDVTPSSLAMMSTPRWARGR
jgi:hypothetical protein